MGKNQCHVLKTVYSYFVSLIYDFYYLNLGGKPIKENFSVLFMYRSNDNFEKKYAKVLQCIIYFVTLRPETLEVFPL